MPTYRMYMTEGCHLCEEAIEMMAAIDPKLLRNVQPVDIVYDDKLIEKYQADIPVLEKPSGAQIRWPFDQAQLQSWLGY